jgi:hypothetical protein
MEEAKTKQIDRKRAAMQKELDRINEDMNRGKKEIDDLGKSMSTVGDAAAQAKSLVEQLTGRKKHVNQDLELIPLRIEAERLKEEALILLNTAHAKAVDALNKHHEELALRAAVISEEIEKMSEAEKAVASDSRKGKSETLLSRSDLRKNLQKAEGRTLLANEKSREAMNAAAQKLLQAEAAAAKAEKKQAEIELDNNPNSPSGDESLKPKAKRGR